MKKMIEKIVRKSEKGQSIVLIALVFVGLLAFIGLTVDMGVLFISYGNLRRAVDNAALAAATQMRENYTIAQLTDSAAQFLRLNNVDADPTTVDVATCDPLNPDLELCPTDKRKLVRVTASVPVKFSFLPVIGFYETEITAKAIAEAASMDVVLVIDISESMADESTPDYLRDPQNCNAEDPTGALDPGVHKIPGECHPFEEVKTAAAASFANWVLNKPVTEEEDRLSVVVFSNGWEAGYTYSNKIPNKGTGIVCPDGARDSNGLCTNSPWMSDYNEAYDLITNLQVYERGTCPVPWMDADYTGACSEYSGPNPTDYIANQCPFMQVNPYPNIADGSTCQTTNIGGGLKLGASLFGLDMRKDALWLVILLTDGAANATEVSHQSDPEYLDAGHNVLQEIKLSLPIGFCPTTGDIHIDNGCRDRLVTTRHTSTNSEYDADDFARDMADLVSCDPTTPKAGCSQAGQGAIMFAIGMGRTVVNDFTPPKTSFSDDNGVPYGDAFLRYAGAVGDDGDPSTDPCAGVPINASGYSCGNYYFSSSGSGLDAVFNQIASRVFTRLAK